MRSTTRKRDGELVVLDGENMSPSRGALRPVTLSQGIVATEDDLKVLAARVNKCGTADRALTARHVGVAAFIGNNNP
jgi:hypothetical protein